MKKRNGDRPRASVLMRLATYTRDIIYRYRLHPKRGFEYVSPAATGMTGYTPEEYYADPDLGMKIVHPDDRAALEEYLRTANFDQPLTVRWIRKDGGVIWTEQENVPVRGRGRIVAIDGIARDVTNRVRAEMAAADRERRLRTVIHHEPECVKILDRECRLLEMNPAGLAMIDADSPGEVLGRDMSELVRPAERTAFRTLVARGFDGRGSALSFGMTGLKGTERWLETHSAPLRDETGAITGLLCITRDATDRYRAEQALRESEERHRHLVAFIPDAVLVHRDGRIVFGNPAAQRLLGAASATDLLGLELLDLVEDEFRDTVRQRIVEMQETQEPAPPMEQRIRRLDGAVIEIEVMARPLSWEGQPAFLVVARDVSERRRALEALRRSEEKFAKAFLQIPDAAVLARLEDGRILEVNDALCQLMGHDAQHLVGRTTTDLGWWGAEGERQQELLKLIRRDGKVRELNIKLTTRSGEVREGVMSGEVFDLGGEPVLLAVAADVTDQRRALEALRRSEQRYRSLVQGAAYGIYRSTVDGRFLDVNPALVAMLGYDSEADLLAVDLASEVYRHGEERARLVEKFRGGEGIAGLEVEWQRKDGTPITVRLSGRPVLDAEGRTEGFEMIVEDISVRRGLEDQLRQAQKMEAIGRLAGGVAHDFNNLLTAITGYADLLRSDLPAQDPRRADVDEIRRAADRAAGLTRQLLAFSRRQVLQPRVIDLHEAVRGTETLLRRIIGEDIELETDLEARGHVRADPSQFEQVLLNLAVNARDAMPRGGKVTIVTRDIDIDTSRGRGGHEMIRPGRYVLLQVSDTGVGMDPETQAHVFEPFFTTKEPGKGTGLGLATVYGIVKQSDGHIGLSSNPGQGTTFTIYLPSVPETAEHVVTAAAVPEVRGGSEVILLVEDEPAVAKLTRGVLERYGYKVLAAERPEEAIQLELDHAHPIHLLLTDVIMPGMSGHELRDQIASRRPDIPVLYISGYAGNAALHGGMLEHGAHFLAKPFSAEALARRVREVLDGPRPTVTS